jgi:hypothetical protein
VGVGPLATVPTPPTPRLHLPHLRNAALAHGTPKAIRSDVGVMREPL